MYDSTVMRTMSSPRTRNSVRQPKVTPIVVITGRPMLIPRVFPAMITVTALPCISSGTSRAPYAAIIGHITPAASPPSTRMPTMSP